MQGRARIKLPVTLLTHVALSYPPVSARGFARTVQDLLGSAARSFGRTAIAKVRDSFAGVLQDFNNQDVEKSVCRAATAHFANAATAKGPLTVALLHIHDEASLRLRSFGQGSLTDRSRKSSVQQHALWLLAEDGADPLPVVSELHALAHKDAPTIATSLDKVLRSVASAALHGLDLTASGEVWFVHVLVGDGIYTNGAAARVLLAKARAAPLALGVVYFIMVVKCANHQANLVIGGIVEGRAALCGAYQTVSVAGAKNAVSARVGLDNPKTAPHRLSCGAVVRLFKYLFNDYYDEFVLALTAHASTLNFVWESDGAAEALVAEGVARAAALERLYGEGVVPPGLRGLLNAGFDRWEHVVPAAERAAQRAHRGVYETRIRAELVECLRRHCLVVDEHPTYTRFFTFAANFGKLLTLCLLNVQNEVLRFVTVAPREENKVRMKKVLSFTGLPGALDYLKRTVLALGLTTHTHAICASVDPGQDPVVVQLAKGRVRIAVTEDLARLASLLPLDPDLDAGAALTLLHATTADTLARFKQYEAYPYLLYKLCAAYNKEYRLACAEFVVMPESDQVLDGGFGLPLHRLALARGDGQQGAVRFLLSPPVQLALRKAFAASGASSLPAERRFAQIKRSEAPRLSHLQTASRNQMQRVFLTERERRLQRIRAAQRAFTRAQTTNAASLAWAERPQDLPAPGAGSSRRCPANTGGDVASLRQYRADHADELRLQAARLRADAKAALDAARAGRTPVTTADWSQWFTENHAMFAGRMKVATEQRRALSRRLVADEGLPSGDRRSLGRDMMPSHEQRFPSVERARDATPRFSNCSMSSLCCDVLATAPSGEVCRCDVLHVAA